MNLCKRVGLLFTLCLLVLVPEMTVHAQEGYGYTRKKNFKTDGKQSEYAYVQLGAMLAPVKRNQTNLSTVKVPITIIVSLNSSEELGYFCKLTPRVQDALVVSFSEAPLTLSYLFDPSKLTSKAYRLDKTEEQKLVNKRLILAMNKSVENNLVVDVLVIKGAKSLGGGVSSRLPFSSILGCTEVEKEEKEKEKKNSN